MPRKKKLQWHTTLGVIKIVEQTFLKTKKRYRPFLIKSKIRHKRCSQKLQRIICDFASDCSFEQTQKKLKEHYNIDLCVETISRYIRRRRRF